MSRSSSPILIYVDVGAAGRIDESPRRNKRAHFCKLCGKQLCSYHVDSKYCYAHEFEGAAREDKIEQERQQVLFRAVYRKKQERLKNESKNNINRSTKGSCV